MAQAHALSPTELVPVDQMSANTRPYFIHHRNQVGINQNLMDLFRLIDFFLQSDPSAHGQACVEALRTISDYFQIKQVIAPMPKDPQELVNYYDEPATQGQAPNPHDLLGETLRNFFSGLPIPPNSPPPHLLAHSIRDSLGMGLGLGAHPHSRMSTLITREPSSTIAPSPRNPGEGTKEVRLSTAPPTIIYPNLGAHPTRSLEDVSCIELAKAKLRSWLARPETSILKRWAIKKSSKSSTDQSSSKRHSSVEPDVLHYSFAPTLPSSPDPAAEFDIRRQRRVSFGGVPNTAPPRLPTQYDQDIQQNRGVYVTTDTFVDRSAPPHRKRAISLTQGKILPPIPISSRENSLDTSESHYKSSTATKLRKHRHAPHVTSSSITSHTDEGAPSTHPIPTASRVRPKRETGSSVMTDSSVAHATIQHASKVPLHQSKGAGSSPTAQQNRATANRAKAANTGDTEGATVTQQENLVERPISTAKDKPRLPLPNKRDRADQSGQSAQEDTIRDQPASLPGLTDTQDSRNAAANINPTLPDITVRPASPAKPGMAGIGTRFFNENAQSGTIIFNANPLASNSPIPPFSNPANLRRNQTVAVPGRQSRPHVQWLPESRGAEAHGVQNAQTPQSPPDPHNSGQRARASTTSHRRVVSHPSTTESVYATSSAGAAHVGSAATGPSGSEDPRKVLTSTSRARRETGEATLLQTIAQTQRVPPGRSTLTNSNQPNELCQINQAKPDQPKEQSEPARPTPMVEPVVVRSATIHSSNTPWRESMFALSPAEIYDKLYSVHSKHSIKPADVRDNTIAPTNGVDNVNEANRLSGVAAYYPTPRSVQTKLSNSTKRPQIPLLDGPSALGLTQGPHGLEPAKSSEFNEFGEYVGPRRHTGQGANAYVASVGQPTDVQIPGKSTYSRSREASWVELELPPIAPITPAHSQLEVRSPSHPHPQSQSGSGSGSGSGGRQGIRKASDYYGRSRFSLDTSDVAGVTSDSADTGSFGSVRRTHQGHGDSRKNGHEQSCNAKYQSGYNTVGEAASAAGSYLASIAARRKVHMHTSGTFASRSGADNVATVSYNTSIVTSIATTITSDAEVSFRGSQNFRVPSTRRRNVI